MKVKKISYEGMGTCISCDVYMDDGSIVSVSAVGTESNDTTERIIEIILAAYSDKVKK